MKNSLLLISSMLCSALAFGCGKDDPGTTNVTATTKATQTATEGEGTTSAGSATDAGTTSGGTADGTTGAASATVADTEPAPTTGNVFLVPTDMIIVGECDVFLQDCKGENEKCEAVITDGGGAWNSSKCVPVSGTDTPGDACTAESVADGLDSCIAGSMCWGVDMDGNGTCVALCMGTADAPICPNNGPCTIANDGFLNLCLPSCDPLAQDCPSANDACYPIDDGFTCAPNASGDTGKQNDPCEFINVCQPGLLCAGPEFVGMGCPPGSMGCCTQFCELPDGACLNADQKCVPWYDPMNIPADAPVNALDIGFCGVMQ